MYCSPAVTAVPLVPVPVRAVDMPARTQDADPRSLTFAPSGKFDHWPLGIPGAWRRQMPHADTENDIGNRCAPGLPASLNVGCDGSASIAGGAVFLSQIAAY